MNGSQYIVDPEGERDPRGCAYGCMIMFIAALVTLTLCLLFPSCKTPGSLSEKVNVRDSVAIHWKDSTRWNIRDSVNIIEHHVTVRDSSGLFIQFGQGGGTYNAKTGEATNVSNVQQTDTHHERKDSTAFYKSRYEALSAVSDSLQHQVSDYASSLAKERQMPKRTGWDRFCTWWFIITALLLLGYLGYKGYRLYLKFQTGGLL